MNNLSSYCGLVDAKIRASEKDLPVQVANFQQKMKLRKCLQVVELLSSRQNMVSIVFFVMDGWSSFTALVSSLRPRAAIQ